jgi:hypothetical protein
MPTGDGVVVWPNGEPNAGEGPIVEIAAPTVPSGAPKDGADVAAEGVGCTPNVGPPQPPEVVEGASWIPNGEAVAAGRLD